MIARKYLNTIHLACVCAALFSGCAASMDVVGTPSNLKNLTSTSGPASETPIVPGSDLTTSPLSPDQILQVCSSRTVQHASHPISFPRPVDRCPWNQGDNLDMLDQHFQTRIEQTSGFQLPPGAVICDMKFVFGTTNFYYDDEFIFDYNGLVLASSFDYSSTFAKNKNFLTYDWSRIKGQAWQAVSQVAYCAGADRGMGTCSWPDTSTQGPFTVSYSPDLVHEITSLTSQNPEHIFHFITTGDNDPSVDCQHEPVDFTVEVSYVQ